MRTTKVNRKSFEAFCQSRILASLQFSSCPIKSFADKNFKLLKENPKHPSLHYKKIARYRSVRVGLSYRELGVTISEGVLWFWIGSHADYDKLVN